MIISYFKVHNWRNFKSLEFEMESRLFIVGPNASGKSNLLDAFRFLRDISSVGGGLQKAIRDRGGMSKIRCLMARSQPDIGFTISLQDNLEQRQFIYELEIMQEPHGNHRTLIRKERVTRNENIILDRPNDEDRADPERLTQTYLEQINSNSQFREINGFFCDITYQHLVPQLIRYPEFYSGQVSPTDPFGKNFMERVSKTPKSTRENRLRKIAEALQIAVPQFKSLDYIQDSMGIPHLQAIYSHWRSKGAKQQESEFSDGTLRLIGFFWTLLEGDSLLLLEEPELYLNAEIVSSIPGLMYRMQKSLKRQRRQIVVSTHSTDLLSDQGISASEVLILKPGPEGTTGKLAASYDDIRALMDQGMSAADAVAPAASPENIHQLENFK